MGQDTLEQCWEKLKTYLQHGLPKLDENYVLNFFAFWGPLRPVPSFLYNVTNSSTTIFAVVKVGSEYACDK